MRPKSIKPGGMVSSGPTSDTNSTKATIHDLGFFRDCEELVDRGLLPGLIELARKAFGKAILTDFDLPDLTTNRFPKG